MEKKQIYLLIGQKGSGKSYIGSLLDKHFNISFIRVENWVKSIQRERRVDNELYIKEVFELIEEGVRGELRNQSSVVFESTGLTEYFDHMLDRLKKDFKVVMLKVSTKPETCLTRIKSRDQSIHVKVSDHSIAKINKKVLEKNIEVDFVIDNNSTDQEKLLLKIKEIISLSSL